MTNSEHRCIVCPRLRQGEPRVFARAKVCDGCRSRLRALLVEVVEHYEGVELEKPSGAGDKVSGTAPHRYRSPLPPWT